MRNLLLLALPIILGVAVVSIASESRKRLTRDEDYYSTLYRYGRR